MDALTVIAFAIKVIQLGEMALAGIVGAATAFQEGATKVKEMVAANRNPTDQEWNDIHAVIDALIAEAGQDAGVLPPT